MYLGIDIGGTTCRIAVYRSSLCTVYTTRKQFPVSQDGDFEHDLEQLLTHCTALSQRHGPIQGIGLAVAGKVSDDRSQLTAAGNLGHWVNQPVAERLATEFDCPVVLGNDAEAAALAEALYGHGRHTDFWFVIWGTGVGGTLVRTANGKPVAFAGELGHQQVRQNSGQQCGCTQMGCLEAYCGGSGILRRHHVPPKELSNEQWQEVLGWMQIGVRNIVTAQPVPLIVFGGGIASKQEQLLPQLEQMLKDELQIVEAPQVKLSHFGESAGTVGALSLLELS